MTIIARCDACHQTFNVSDDKAGKKFRCKNCDQLVQVPLLAEGTEDWEIVDDQPVRSENWYAGEAADPRPTAKGKKLSSGHTGPVEDDMWGINWYLEGWKNAINFSGRARRKEYWMFIAGNVLILSPIVFIESLTRDHVESLTSMTSIMVFSFVIFIPSLSLQIRRLHDIGLSGWWYLINFIPFGSLIMLFLSVKDSEPGTNKWGPSPKYS
ncbi:MAG TPA: DUF805 domain-containing protein [Planctomicrobium sp.]|nr:DUF805 domain-containing protein [Planctomicrobium sp.]